jgi:hypothetical protein
LGFGGGARIRYIPGVLDPYMAQTKINMTGYFWIYQLGGQGISIWWDMVFPKNFAGRWYGTRKSGIYGRKRVHKVHINAIV